MINLINLQSLLFVLKKIFFNNFCRKFAESAAKLNREEDIWSWFQFSIYLFERPLLVPSLQRLVNQSWASPQTDAAGMCLNIKCCTSAAHHPYNMFVKSTLQPNRFCHLTSASIMCWFSYFSIIFVSVTVRYDRCTRWEANTCSTHNAAFHWAVTAFNTWQGHTATTQIISCQFGIGWARIWTFCQIFCMNLGLLGSLSCFCRTLVISYLFLIHTFIETLVWE